MVAKKKCLVLFNGVVWGDLNSVVDNALNILSAIVDPTALISTWKSCESSCDLDKKVLKIFHEDINDNYLDSIGFPYTQQLTRNTQWSKFRLGHYANFVNVANTLFSTDLSQYDYVVKTRTDLMLDFIPPENLLSESVYTFPTFWGGQLGDNRFLNDHFLLGTKGDVVDVYRGVLDIKKELSQMWNPEMYMKYLTHKAKKKIVILQAKKYHIKKSNDADSIQYI
jgi:hypothetical protein